MTTITNEHALALVALDRATTAGDHHAARQARIDCAKHEARARRALLTPHQLERLEAVEGGIPTLLAHTTVVTGEKDGRVNFIIDPEVLHLTLKERG